MSGLSVSFIVPCYCTEKRLLMRCLRSILALGGDIGLEILLIDDGTPQSQVERWAEELGDSRIHYHYQENAGQGAARNWGLRHAKGEYVQFVDSDDYLLGESYRQCLSLVERRSPDLLMFGYRKVYGDDFSDNPPRHICLKEYADGIDYMLRNSMLGVVCNVIVRRSVVSSLRFPEKILHEDEEFAPLMLLNTGKMVTVNLIPYAYYQRAGSTMDSSDVRHLDRRFGDFFEVVGSLGKYNLGLDGRKKAALSRRVDQLCEAFVYDVIRFSPDGSFLDKWIGTLEKNGMYPVRFRRYNLKYILFWALTCRKWMVELLYCVNKKLKLL